MEVWDKNNLTWEVYSLLSKLKDNFDLQEEIKDFNEYIDIEIKKLKSSAIEWLAEDEKQPDED